MQTTKSTLSYVRIAKHHLEKGDVLKACEVLVRAESSPKKDDMLIELLEKHLTAFQVNSVDTIITSFFHKQLFINIASNLVSKALEEDRPETAKRLATHIKNFEDELEKQATQEAQQDYHIKAARALYKKNEDIDELITTLGNSPKSTEKDQFLTEVLGETKSDIPFENLEELAEFYFTESKLIIDLGHVLEHAIEEGQDTDYINSLLSLIKEKQE